MTIKICSLRKCQSLILPLKSKTENQFSYSSVSLPKEVDL